MTATVTTAAIPAPFEWSAERVALARRIAEDGGTAREACEAVGLDLERAYLAYKLAEREGFKFRNVGGKRDDLGVFVKLPDKPTADLLAASAHLYGQTRRDHAAQLLTLILRQGPVLIKNLLDEADA